MRALRKTDRGEGFLALLDVPAPEPPPGWVVLDVAYAGICGTDIHILHDEHPYYPPVTLGHEFVARIARLGPGVEGWPVGERVVCEPHQGACGVCAYCRRGLPHLCPHKRSPGWGIDGAMAPQLTMPAHLLHRVPPEVSDRAAAACEPTAVCVTAAERCPIGPGDGVVVVGPGPIGMLMALVAQALGAGEVVLVGRPSSAARLELARRLGLTTWDSTQVDVAEAARRLGPGEGADVAIDASGSAEGIRACVSVLRRAGRLCALGVTGRDELPFPWDEAMRRALDIHFSLSSSPTSWDRSLALMRAGRVDPTPLTAVFPLGQWADAFRAVEERRVVKALLAPDGDDR